jgi:hypothetical protein
LSARRIRIAYFNETTRINDQMISETAPSTASGVGEPSTLAALIAALKA